jgi:hypothetical protein
VPVPRHPTVVEILDEFCDYAKSLSKSSTYGYLILIFKDADISAVYEKLIF